MTSPTAYKFYVVQIADDGNTIDVPHEIPMVIYKDRRLRIFVNGEEWFSRRVWSQQPCLNQEADE